MEVTGSGNRKTCRTKKEGKNTRNAGFKENMQKMKCHYHFVLLSREAEYLYKDDRYYSLTNQTSSQGKDRVFY